MSRRLCVLSLVMLAGSTASIAATESAEVPKPKDAQAPPQVAQPRPQTGPLRPPEVFLPPTRPTPLLPGGEDSSQRQPVGPRQASSIAHRTERHSSTIFSSPAIEAPRRFGPVQPVQIGPTPLKRRTFAW